VSPASSLATVAASAFASRSRDGSECLAGNVDTVLDGELGLDGQHVVALQFASRQGRGAADRRGATEGTRKTKAGTATTSWW